MLLAGDIGATKTILAVYSQDDGPRKPLAEATYPSTQYASLEEVVRQFLAHVQLPVDRGSFGVAGPVVAGRAKVTNLPWELSQTQLQLDLGLSSVKLWNDLESVASAVPHLEPGDLHMLNLGEPAHGGAIAVVAPGTGLGEAYLTWNGKRYLAHPCEGGHTDFAPCDSLQMELLCYLQRQYTHVSYERVCSGIGLPNIYSCLKEGGYAEEPAWLAEEMAVAEDPTPLIVRAAMDQERPCELCSKTLDVFISVLGAEAGNLALKVLASGGVYLAGGIPRRILPLLQKGIFMRAFRDKGRMADLMCRMPVYVILNPKVGLLGAAYLGFETYGR